MSLLLERLNTNTSNKHGRWEVTCRRGPRRKRRRSPDVSVHFRKSNLFNQKEEQRVIFFSQISEETQTNLIGRVKQWAEPNHEGQLQFLHPAVTLSPVDKK